MPHAAALRKQYFYFYLHTIGWPYHHHHTPLPLAWPPRASRTQPASRRVRARHIDPVLGWWVFAAHFWRRSRVHALVQPPCVRARVWPSDLCAVGGISTVCVRSQSIATVRICGLHLGGRAPARKDARRYSHRDAHTHTPTQPLTRK